jgi:hypothetical protein
MVFSDGGPLTSDSCKQNVSNEWAENLENHTNISNESDRAHRRPQYEQLTGSPLCRFR